MNASTEENNKEHERGILEPNNVAAEDIENNTASEDEEQLAAKPTKKARNNYFVWTAHHNLIFMRTCQSKLVHSNKGAMKKEEKCQAVINHLKSRKENDFEFLDIKAKAVGEKFRKDTSIIMEKYGFTKDSVNLSGLSDKPPPYDDLVLNMAHEAKAENAKAKRAKEKLQRSKFLLNGVEKSSLSQQSHISSLVPQAVVNNQQDLQTPQQLVKSISSSSVLSSSTSTGNPRSATTVGTSFLESTTNRIIDAIRGSNDSAPPQIQRVEDVEQQEYDREKRKLELELLRASVAAKQEEANYWRREDK